MNIRSIFFCLQNEISSTNTDGDLDKTLSKKNGNQTFQVLLTINASLTMVGLGASDSWTSPALPHLQSNESELQLSPKEAPWIASLLHIGAIIGYLIYPYLIDTMGRKKTLLLFFLPQITSWVLTIYAKNVYTLYVARTIAGIGYCGGFAVVSVYISEISAKSVRGICMFVSKISYEIGGLIVVSIGAFFAYEEMNVSMLALPLIFFVTFIFMPETPHYFLKRGNNEKAIESLLKLRGAKNHKCVEFEINSVRSAMLQEENDENIFQAFLADKRYRKALLIVFVANVTKGLSGSYAIGNYSQQIFSYSGFTLKAEYATIIVVALKIIAGIIGSQLIEKVGRRVLYFYSGILGGLSLIMVGLFFFIKFYLKMDNLTAISWLPLFGLTCFQVASAASLNPIPIILTVELFPTKIRSFASAVAFISFESFVFLITFAFDPLNQIVGIYTTFWIYAFCCMVGTFIVYRITPETKGKSLEEIQDLLM